MPEGNVCAYGDGEGAWTSPASGYMGTRCPISGMPWSLSLAWAEAGRSVEAEEWVRVELVLERCALPCTLLSSLSPGVPAFPMPAAAAWTESVRVTVETLAFAVKLEIEGLGACRGRSLPTFRV